MNCPDDMEIDHIYHDEFDNRKNNLRIVTSSQNGMNKKIFKNNTSGVTGVSWNNTSQSWTASIQVNNKRIYFGNFSDFKEAVKVRKWAEEKYFGEYKYKEK